MQISRISFPIFSGIKGNLTHGSIVKNFGKIQDTFERTTKTTTEDKHNLSKKTKGFPVVIANPEDDSIQNQEKHANILKQLAQTPQSSYDKLINDIVHINKKGLRIKPSNILYNEEKKQFKFVDVTDNKQDDDNQLAKVLYSVLGGEYGVNYMNKHYSEPESEDVKDNTVSISIKFFKAMENNGTKFTKGKYINKLVKSKLLDYSLLVQSQRQKRAELKHLGLMD